MSEILIPTGLFTFFADGSIADEVVMLSEVPDAAELSIPLGRILNGPFRHVVIRPAGEDKRDMFVREDAEGMPVNEKATRMYRNMLMAGTRQTDRDSLPSVYGTAVVASRKLWVG